MGRPDIELGFLRPELGGRLDAERVAAVGQGGEEVCEDQLEALEGRPHQDVRVEAGVEAPDHGQHQGPALVQRLAAAVSRRSGHYNSILSS